MHSNPLELIKQTSLKEEKITKNGQTQNVHVIVKNSPFQMVCGYRDPSFNINLNEFSFDIKLIYDMDDEKEVSWVKIKPVEYKPTVNEEGNQISFDTVKIKVLSSHHEDNLFRLKLSMWKPENDEIYSLLSNPIKVISKPLRSKPKKSQTVSDDHTSHNPSSRMKRSHSLQKCGSQVKDRLNDTLASKIETLLEEQQKTTQELRDLKKELASQTLNSSTTIHSFYQKQEGESSQHMEGMSISTVLNSSYENLVGEPPKNIENGFTGVLSMISDMEPNEVFDNVRNLLRSLSTREISKLVELVDILQAAGLNDMHKVCPRECIVYH